MSLVPAYGSYKYTQNDKKKTYFTAYCELKYTVTSKLPVQF